MTHANKQMDSKINNNEIDITVHVRINKDSLKSMAIVCLILILIAFLFLGGGGQQSHRLVKDIWDAGHLVLFGLISFIYFFRPENAKRSLIYKIFFTTIASLFLGTVIELFQLLIHRGFSVDDIVNDVIGGYLGLLGLMIFNNQQALMYRTIAGIIFVVFLTVGLRGFEKHLFDEFSMWKQFPVLASFENQIEMERWELLNVNVRRSQQFVKSGKYSFEVEFLRGRYPTVSLSHLRPDWSAYNKLMFSVYSPSRHDLEFEVKVYDQAYIERGGEYADRFNEEITLTHGWNTVEISVPDIIRAPKQRSMDIHEIKLFSLFADKLVQPVTLYIDDIHLI